MLIRHADPERDAGACLSIYAPHVTGSAVSFEETVPTVQEFSDRMAALSDTHAFLVAEDRGRVAGYAYGGMHRSRAAYRWAAETSVYIAPGYRQRGLGRALYSPLLELLSRQGFGVAVAGITLPNPGSIALHGSVGFRQIGIYPRIGFKNGSWQDVLWMSRALAAADPEGAAPAPPAPPGPPVRLDQPLEVHLRPRD